MTYVALTLCYKLRSFFTLITSTVQALHCYQHSTVSAMYMTLSISIHTEAAQSHCVCVCIHVVRQNHDKQLVEFFHHCKKSSHAQKLHNAPLFRIVNYQKITTKVVQSRVHIVGQRANRYIVAFHIMILRYCTIFTGSVQATRPPCPLYSQVCSVICSRCLTHNASGPH